MNKKRIIGITSVNRENKIGSIYTALVVLDPNFKRKHPRIKGEFDPEFIKIAKNDISQYECCRITPNHMKYDIEEMLSEQYGDLLNMVERFWKNSEIVHDLEDISPKLHVQVRNMAKITEDIFTYNPSSYAVKVAKQFANMFLFKESVEIKRIYGEFGTGREDDEMTQSFIKENPTCVWVRHEKG